MLSKIAEFIGWTVMLIVFCAVMGFLSAVVDVYFNGNWRDARRKQRELDLEHESELMDEEEENKS